MNNKRKHHIIPSTYLSGFTDQNGKIYQYLKDYPTKPQYNVPRELGYRRDYYSQPLDNGTTDFNSLEDTFSALESTWPSLVRKINNQVPLSSDDLSSLITFITLLKVRVPASRDAIEKMLAETVKMTGEMLERQGKMPPRPEELVGEELSVSIDPHRSILAMADMAVGFNRIFNSLNFIIIKNRTKIPLLTSDNPVVFFDPRVSEKIMQPYAQSLDHLEFIFPISSTYLLYGNSNINDSSWPYKVVSSDKAIRRFNRLICKFGYERIFSSNDTHKTLIQKYSDKSPVLDISCQKIGDGNLLLTKYLFATREKLPKWDKDNDIKD